MKHAAALLAFLLPAASLAAAPPFTLERGGVKAAVPVVERDGVVLLPLGTALRQALAGLVAVAARPPFATLTYEDLEAKLACGMTRVALGDGRTACLPDAPRMEGGVPAVSPRVLAGMLGMLGLKSSWAIPDSHLVLEAPPPPAAVPATAATPVPAAPARASHIMLDAGHGGEDCGAQGRGRLCEKVVTLDMARRLRTALEAAGVRVSMTREDDRTVTLQQRVEAAQEANPDLFVSLHVNASRNRAARGVETYVYGQNVGSRSVADLVRRENAEANYVDIIVNDLQQRLHHDSSIRVAGSVEDSMVRRLKAHGRGGKRVKEAPFYVLARARRPAVLLEIGFISNAEEERKLRDPSWRQRVADSIAEGLRGLVRGIPR